MKRLAEDFIRLLGKPHTDNDVNSLMLSLGIKSQYIRLKRGEYSVNFPIYPYGVELVFSDSANFLIAETLKERALIFSTVFFYGDSIPILPIDRWIWKKLKLAIDFTEDESQIASISVGISRD